MERSSTVEASGACRSNLMKHEAHTGTASYLIQEHTKGRAAGTSAKVRDSEMAGCITGSYQVLYMHGMHEFGLLSDDSDEVDIQ